MTKCSCHGAHGSDSETIVAPLERPRYSPGLILEDSDLTAAVTYTQQLNRLLFRNLFGCGVVCGLTVSAKGECGHEVTVEEGLALDGCGDPIQVTRPIKIKLDKNRAVRNGVPQPFWVLVCAGEKLCAPRTLVCDADDFEGATQQTRIRSTATVSISFDERICACVADKAWNGEEPKPVGDECSADCGCESACACDCCVVLARVTGQREGERIVWTAHHHGYRRFVRPQMKADPRQQPAAQAPARPEAEPEAEAPVEDTEVATVGTIMAPAEDAVTAAAPVSPGPRPDILVRDATERLTRAFGERPGSTIGRNTAIELIRTTLSEMSVDARPEPGPGDGDNR
jgi:hypothetical protein